MAKGRKKAASGAKPKKKGRSMLVRILVFPFRTIAWIYRAIRHLAILTRCASQQMRTGRTRKSLGEASGYRPLEVVESIGGEWGSFEKRLMKGKSTIGIILGARGTGKTALGMRLLENIYVRTKRKCCCMGFHAETLPSWLSVITDINQAAKGSAILIDEGGILYSSRESMSAPNKILSDALLIARHNDLSIIFISQNSANLEINALRQADYLLLKPSSLLQKDFERQKIKDVYEKASAGFARHQDDAGITYVYATEFQGFVSNTLPSFWTVEVSKSFRK